GFLSEDLGGLADGAAHAGVVAGLEFPDAPGGRLAAQQPAAGIAHPGGLPRPQRHLLPTGAAAGGTAPDPPPAPRPERKGKRTAVRPAVARQPARIARRARRALAGAPVAVSPAGSRSAPGGSGQ